MAYAPATDPLTILGTVSLFGDLSDEELHALSRRTVQQHVAGGEVIFHEGDECRGFYVVESGEVKIFKTAPSGREQVLTVDRAGNSMAEVPVFDGGPYPASAVATMDSTLLFVSKREFRALVLEHPEVGLKVLKNVGGRLRRLVALIEDLSFTTVRGRLIGLLARVAAEQGTKSEVGTEIAVPGNQEIAAHIGTVRELVSRNMGRLQAEGLIRVDGKRVIIPDLAKLTAAGDEG